MIQNYLVTALRNFARHKLYSFINIAGLAVGLACAIFIILYLNDELSYDKWIPDSQDIYRVEAKFFVPGGQPRFFTVVPFPVPLAMQAQIPQVVAQTHLIPEDFTAKIGDRLFLAHIAVVDPNFLQVIKLPLVKGDPARVLTQPDSVVLSETTARTYFGSADPIGKTVIIADTHPLTVTGVLRDVPHNSQMTLVTDLLMPNTSKADTMDQQAKQAWLNVQGWGYVKFAPGADLSGMDAKLKAIADKGIDAKKQVNVDIPGSDILHLHLTPFRQVHVAAFGETEPGNWAMIYGFAAIAALILLIACFNFMNLATARAMIRAREVSLRKVVGATRRQLMVQFLGESVMTALIALILAVILVKLLLPVFDSFLTLPITFNLLGDWPLTLAALLIAIAAGLFGGVYPALILSGFRPAGTLGTSNSGMSGSGLLRTVLVVTQFAISIGLGIATIVVFAQMHYVQQVNIGFDRHNLVVVNGTGPLTPTTRYSMQQTLAADPAIAGVGASNMTPFSGGIIVTEFKLPGSGTQYTMRDVNIDPDFAKVWGMKLLAGRNFSRDRGEDIAPAPADIGANTHINVVITEAAARQFGFTVEGVVGKTVIAHFGGPGKFVTATIVGVLGDTNFDGMQTEMQPVIFFYRPQGVGVLSVRVKPGQTEAALAAIDRIWRRFMPTHTINRQFEDESFDKLFAAAEKQASIFAIFVGVAVFIACLGLFGLAAFTTERRTREIGIRKVFGARTRDIVRLLLWQFSIPVLIANAIAWPVAWFYLRHWLQGYAYRISLNPLYFVAASLITLAIAWITVVAHAVRVARANPVRALRYE